MDCDQSECRFLTQIWSQIVVGLKINRGGNMNRYTNFILTVIAVLMLGILFKDNFITAAHAQQSLWDYTWAQNEKIIDMLEGHI